MKAICKYVRRSTSRVLWPALLAIVLGVGFGSAPRPAHAQFVCANCSTWLQQLLEYAEQLLQYAKQIEQYQLQIDQYRNQVKNTMTIGRVTFDNALATVRGIEQVMNNPSLTNIRYMMGSLDSDFNRSYRDVYGQMQVLRGITGQQALQDYTARNRQAYDTALSALRAARSQSNDLTSDQARMDEAGAELIGADGNLDALQAAGEYAQMTAQQLMKMRQLALIQIQMQSTVIADQARKDEIERAALELWVEDRPAQPVATPRTSSGF